VEFHGPQRVLAERVLGLRPVHIGRGDYAFTVGFPGHLASAFAKRAVGAGVSVVLPVTNPGKSGSAPAASGPTLVVTNMGPKAGAALWR